jgi:hypothetical protein
VSQASSGQTAYGRLQVGRNASLFTDLPEGLNAQVTRQGTTDLSLVSMDSPTVPAHHDAPGMIVAKDVIEALEEAAAEQGQARQ